MTTDLHQETGDDAISDAAVRLWDAARSGTPCKPVRDLLGEIDIDSAYAVQRSLTERRLAAGATVIGRKIGLTSPAVQRQLGVDQPDFGVLFDDMDASDENEIDVAGLLQPRIEAEIAFVLGADLGDGALELDQVRAAVSHARAALEIVDSRVAGWDIVITDTVADNASSGRYVLGPSRRRLDEFEPRAVTMSMHESGETVSEGNGTACLGDPLVSLQWLARTAREHGDPLRAGQVVLSGALGPMVPVRPGTSFRAHISSLGTVAAKFVGKELQ